MDKNRYMYFVGALLYVNLTALVILGLLLKFVIPTGARAIGSPPSFLGLSRHGWADLHGTLGILFIVLTVAHLLLNWNWVVQSSKRYFQDKWVKALLVLSAVWVPIIFVGWIVSR
ncbi:DUF4405 domain-containing protein [Desulfosoma caldarium]|uniref:Uncharacterized protein DUF4405 n=1 Tax=Desulfosoma caldarium TaxID=610254 RepID=A0A3N1UN64_9BACT|nr:DUF4405 domain-containing protein [Desulfosoma caldarium]ROQ89917.1 uncharacterized protein DUF4405 [Desulfosoma caldarium]